MSCLRDGRTPREKLKGKDNIRKKKRLRYTLTPISSLPFDKKHAIHPPSTLLPSPLPPFPPSNHDLQLTATSIPNRKKHHNTPKKKKANHTYSIPHHQNKTLINIRHRSKTLWKQNRYPKVDIARACLCEKRWTEWIGGVDKRVWEMLLFRCRGGKAKGREVNPWERGIEWKWGGGCRHGCEFLQTYICDTY